MRIITYIVNDEKKPSKYKLRDEFESLTVEKLDQLKEIYKQYGVITFEYDDLFDEEIQLVSKLNFDNKSNEEISQITLIHIDLVEKICRLK